jgi:hypothetical protein
VSGRLGRGAVGPGDAGGGIEGPFAAASTDDAPPRLLPPQESPLLGSAAAPSLGLGLGLGPSATDESGGRAQDCSPASAGAPASLPKQGQAWALCWCCVRVNSARHPFTAAATPCGLR